MSDLNGKWGYSTDRENYYGDYDTKEEAIEDGRGYAVVVGQFRKPSDPESYVEADDIIGKVLRQEDYSHEWADGTLECPREVRDELTSELRTVFSAWIDRHDLRPQFGLIDPDTEEDIKDD